MKTTIEFIKKESEKLGYQREYFLEKNIPENPSDIVVVSFYGELRSLFWFSAVVLKKLVAENPGKYFIICSWPNMRGLFPYVNEYWSIKDMALAQRISDSAGFFNNSDDFIVSEHRNLIYRFENVYKTDDFNLPSIDKQPFELLMPQVPSIGKVGQYIRNQLTKDSVVIFPSKNVYSWESKELQPFKVPKAFWNKVIHKLLSLGYKPVVWQNALSYDVSPDFAETCTYLSNMPIEDVLAVMHETGVVFDVFSGVSKLALQARSSFVALDERERYIEQHDGLLEGQLLHQLQKLYVFSFAKFSLNGTIDDWCTSFLDAALVKLEYLKNSIDKQVDYVLNQTCDSIDCIPKKKKYKKMGLHFIT